MYLSLQIARGNTVHSRTIHVRKWTGFQIKIILYSDYKYFMILAINLIIFVKRMPMRENSLFLTLPIR